MPAWLSSAPRKKLPPPMTTATCVPLATASANCSAIPRTMSASTPTLPPPKVSPESLSSTRWYPLPSAGWKAVGADSGGVVSVNASSLARIGCLILPHERTAPLPGRERGRSSCAGPSGLADLEAGEPLHGQAGVVGNLLDRALGLGDRRLLEQDEVLVEGVDPTLDDLGDRLLGLALLLRGLLGDAALGLDRLGRHLVAGEVARARGGDVHRQAARGLLGPAGVLHRDTDRRGQVGGPLVQVGGGRALEDGEAAQDELLADAGGLALDQRRDGLAVDVGGQQRVDVGRLLGQHDVEQPLGELDEVGVLGDEVGLAVQLEQRAVLAHDDAVRGGALEALADVLGALDAQELDGLVEVAVGLGERLLAVHHAGAS